MTYLVIALAIAFIVAPFFAILPSRRQKELMALRRAAAAKGVNVGITTIEDPIPNQDKYKSNYGKPLPPHLTVSAYRRARRQSTGVHLAEPVPWAVERRAEGDGSLPGSWCWSPERPEQLAEALASFVARSLPDLPDDVVRIEDSGNLVTVFWHERGGEEGLSAVVGFLDASVAANADDSSEVS